MSQITSTLDTFSLPAQEANARRGDAVAVAKLPALIDDWLADCRIRQHSLRTIALRRDLASRLLWFLHERKHASCSRAELRSFFAYLAGGHEHAGGHGSTQAKSTQGNAQESGGRCEAGGRWGKSEARYRKPLRAATINTYYRHLGSFFNWLVGEEYLAASPMAKIAPPLVRPDQVQPFTPDQVTALLNATQKSKYPRRDEAMIRFLLDTGVRVSELCALKMQDMDLIEGQAYVTGKGNKRRLVCFGRKTQRALRVYLRDEERTPQECVFLAERGQKAGEPFCRGGVLQLVERLGKRARLQGVRCSPHTFRHTFAVEFLRNGGNVFTLKQMLGHTDLQVTNRYVALAQADIASQHRQFSPGDRI